MRTFFIDCDDNEFPSARVTALENALQNFVKTNVTLAVEVLFVDGEEICRLNREMRGVDKVTDVLSFPTLDGIKGQALQKQEHPFDIDEEGRLMLGSIVVCAQRAREQAEEYGHSYERELHYLIVHGVMHCLGYDHEEEGEKAEMRTKEEFVLNKLGIQRGE